MNEIIEVSKVMIIRLQQMADTLSRSKLRHVRNTNGHLVFVSSQAIMEILALKQELRTFIHSHENE